MASIDWSKLYQATSRENRPTPGYLLNEIVYNVSHATPKELPAVANYLTECVDGDHAHVKLKALFVIKSLAYRIPPFCQCMQERLPSVQEATAFTGPPSEMYGDEPYRLVREAATGAVAALSGSEFYHQQYRQISQRIVGFGNYQPADDTLLPDGSVNVGKNISYVDVAMGAVSAIGSGVSAVVGGVKDLLSSPFGSKYGLDTLGDGDEAEQVAGSENDQERAEEIEDMDEENDCRDSVGGYEPPSLPLQSAGPLCTGEHMLDVGVSVIVEPCDDMLVCDTETDASFMRVLGMHSSAHSSSGSAAGHISPDDGVLDEAEILAVLGLSQGCSSTRDPPTSSSGSVDAVAARMLDGSVSSSFEFINRAHTAEDQHEFSVLPPSCSSLDSSVSVKPDVVLLGNGFMEV